VDQAGHPGGRDLGRAAQTGSRLPRGFNWIAAVVLGAVVALVIAGVGTVLLKRVDDH
jgi:hypothetical protein